MLKPLYIVLGSISLVLGIIGIVLPGLPTTPFLLLSAYLYMKGSPALHKKLVENRYLGGRIRRYEKNKGLYRYEKTYSIVLMWIMVSISAWLIISNVNLRIVVLAAACVGTAVVWFWVPNAKR
jgi:uncharacterized membrane protein YbaN (DUF454 family)